ncbi:MAG: AMP-binding protein [Anaerolineales bacterium]|nr:AMP-binding protein [Anaerolineales bacterium]
MQTDLFARLQTNATKHPDKPAFIYPHHGIWKTVTYAQLLDSTNRFAHGLQACSLTPGMRAAVMTPPGIEFFPFAFALLKLGIIPIIMDPAIGLKKLGPCINETEPEIFIGNTLTHALRIILGWGKKTIKHNLTIEHVKHQALNVKSLIHPSSFILQNSSPAAIIFTSGSTGTPKGVLYSQENFSAQLDLLQQTFQITLDEIDLPAFPLYAIIDALLGVTSVIPDVTFPVPGKTNPEKVLNAIQKFKVTNMFASPVVLDILCSFALSGDAVIASTSKRTLRLHRPTTAVPLKVELSSLKRVITAGAPATIPLQEKFRKLLDDKTNLFGTYGATETLPIAKVESREIFSLRGKTAQGAGVCLGKPIEGVTVRIIQITDEPIKEWQESLTVETNVVGEITVQSAATTRSYIHREDATRLSKIRIGEDIIHRTGDVGYFDEEGRLWYCGRKSQRVETNRSTFFTEQIEGVFNIHPSAYRTALVGVEKEPVLWIEPKQGKVNQDKIKQELMELASNHPQASKIRTFLFMKKFPTDVRHNSKIIREELTLLAEKRIR